jgi:putative membrane protein
VARIILTVLLNALVIFAVAKLTPGVRIRNYGSAIGVAIVYAVLTWALKWLLITLTFPLILVTFGGFLLVINAFLLWLTDKLIDGFEIKGFVPLAMTTLGVTLGGVVVHWLMAMR